MEVVSQSPRFSFTSEAITVEISEDQKTPSFKIYKGLFTGASQVYDKKAVLGDLVQTPAQLRFIPLLPFQKNSEYTLIYNSSIYPFKIELDASYVPVQVETIYPNSTVLPSNFLKWYIQFSKPINPSKIYDHIYLIDKSDSTKIDRALLPLETPLLSDDGTLLTLWIEPGRQKRDLGPNKQLGEVLTAGKSYTLVIGQGLKDHQGILMNESFTHPFTVEPPDRIQPTVTSWKLQLPTAQTKEPLYIDFQEFLDYGSLQNSLLIRDESGEEFMGTFTVDTNQKGIQFTPLLIWNKSTYIVSSKPIVEDLSGNNLERLFDRDVTIETKTPVLERRFRIE